MYYLFRPENERDYGQEVIEILLTEMENERGDLVVIFAGYPDRMVTFYAANPGLREAFSEYLTRRMARPNLSNARSVRNAIERSRLRQAGSRGAEVS